MRVRRIDLVHSHMYRSNVPATVAAHRAGIRHVWCQVHNVDTWESRRQLWVDRYLCRWREGMLAVSEEVRRDVIEKLKLPEDRVRLLYNGVDVERFKPRPDSELRSVLGAAPGDVVVLFAARLVEQKRPHDFLELARRVLETPGLEHVRFWIAGDGVLRDEVEGRAWALSPERIRLLGSRDDMPELLAAADVFVMTSTREGFSNALLEAMASGLCSVATDAGGNAEAIRSGSDGVIVPPRDAAALWDAVRPMLEDAGRREVFAKSARLRAESFSVDKMVSNLEALYESSVA
jgi:glycosyltransferase involved in cell wall biosynthesis